MHFCPDSQTPSPAGKGRAAKAPAGSTVLPAHGQGPCRGPAIPANTLGWVVWKLASQRCSARWFWEAGWGKRSGSPSSRLRRKAEQCLWEPAFLPHPGRRTRGSGQELCKRDSGKQLCFGDCPAERTSWWWPLGLGVPGHPVPAGPQFSFSQGSLGRGLGAPAALVPPGPLRGDWHWWDSSP